MFPTFSRSACSQIPISPQAISEELPVESKIKILSILTSKLERTLKMSEGEPLIGSRLETISVCFYWMHTKQRSHLPSLLGGSKNIDWVF